MAAQFVEIMQNYVFSENLEKKIFQVLAFHSHQGKNSILETQSG